MDDALFDTRFVAAARQRLDPARLEPALARVNAAMADTECRIVLVTGASGAGKTSLLALLADGHPKWPRFFIRDDTGHDRSLESFVAAIGSQCARLWPPSAAEPRVVIKEVAFVDNIEEGGVVTGVSISEIVADPYGPPEAGVAIDVTASVGVMTGRVDRLVTPPATASYPPEALAPFALDEPASRVPVGERLVVLVDGLGATPGDAGQDVLGWLIDSARLPANVRFVVAIRDDDPRLNTLHMGHSATLRMVEL